MDLSLNLLQLLRQILIGDARSLADSSLGHQFFLSLFRFAAASRLLLAAPQLTIAAIFACGFFQVTLSTPGVFLPLFSVTRLTAIALPLNE